MLTFNSGTRFYVFIVFFFNDSATTEIYTLSLHDALPISREFAPGGGKAGLKTRQPAPSRRNQPAHPYFTRDRKSTRLNSSHSSISYAVFCLKKKNKGNVHCDQL